MRIFIATAIEIPSLLKYSTFVEHMEFRENGPEISEFFTLILDAEGEQESEAFDQSIPENSFDAVFWDDEISSFGKAWWQEELRICEEIT
ncbi:MAG: hypothetical protein AAF236_02025 [Verrucomicrobiota bacterium]